MGWKSVKEYYGIEHIVCVSGHSICIGSPYVRDIIVIGLDGVVRKRYGTESPANAQLRRYQQAFDADPDKLRELVLAQDTFGAAIVVYTYDGGNIIEKLCELPGWPNVTHDGQLMYDNTFSTDKTNIIRRAKREASAGIGLVSERVADLEKELLKANWLASVFVLWAFGSPPGGGSIVVLGGAAWLYAYIVSPLNQYMTTPLKNLAIIVLIAGCLVVVARGLG